MAVARNQLNPDADVSPHSTPARLFEVPPRRDALVTQYRPYVYKLARSVAAMMPGRLDVEDLAGWGFLGLIEAASRYDASRGVSFRSFAHHRIRGAIVDGIRFELGRSTAGPDRDVDGARDAFPPLRAFCLDASYRIRRDDETFDDFATPDFWSITGRSHLAPPDRAVWLAELRNRLEAALRVLSPLERAVIHHYYIEGETVQSLAKRLNLSKSWLSRIHTRALVRLRVHLQTCHMTREAFV